LIPDQREAGEPGTDNPSLSDMRVFAGQLLARREYAVQELQARLLKKWAGKWSGSESIESLVATFIASLQAEGALSDERFAASFIRSRCQRYQGPLKIQAELRQRGVPEHLIESQLQDRAEEWVPLAASWLSRQHSGALDFAGRARYYRRLINRGFSHLQAMAALQGFSEQ
jgi:regulatory protein